jgi:hypothetical protein
MSFDHYSIYPNTNLGSERKRAFKIAKDKGIATEYYPKYNKLAKLDARDAMSRLTKLTGMEWYLCESEWISWM